MAPLKPALGLLWHGHSSSPDPRRAEVAELADALHSGCSARQGVEVRVLSSAYHLSFNWLKCGSKCLVRPYLSDDWFILAFWTNRWCLFRLRNRHRASKGHEAGKPTSSPG